MANAVPVHSSKKGKVNDSVPEEQSAGPVQPSESQGSLPVQPSESQGSLPVQPSESQAAIPLGVKLESHQAWRLDN